MCYYTLLPSNEASVSTAMELVYSVLLENLTSKVVHFTRESILVQTVISTLIFTQDPSMRHVFLVSTPDHNTCMLKFISHCLMKMHTHIPFISVF